MESLDFSLEIYKIFNIDDTIPYSIALDRIRVVKYSAALEDSYGIMNRICGVLDACISELRVLMAQRLNAEKGK